MDTSSELRDSAARECAPYRPDLPFKGAVEIIAGREYPSHGTDAYRKPGTQITNSGHFFAPGTCISGDDLALRMDSRGRLAWMNLP